MAGTEKIRLIKIASEINIGKDTIVEYLHSKGFSIDNKPTAILSEEMADLVYEKFKREKKAADKVREKIQKHKEIRKGPDNKFRKPSDDISHEHGLEHDSTRAVDNKHFVESVANVIEEPPIHPDLVHHHEPVHEDTEPVIEHVHGETEATVENKLEAIETPHVDSEQKHEIKKAPKPEPTIVIEDQDQVIVISKDELFKGDTEILIEEPSIIDPAKIKDLPIIDEITEDEEEDPSKEASKEREVRRDKRKKKKKKLIEVAPGEAPQLKGLTIVGKIDLVTDSAANIERAKIEKIKSNKKKDKRPRTDEVESADSQKNKKKKIKGKEREIEVAPVEDKNPLKAKDKDKKDEKKRKKRKKSIREQISQEEVDKAIRQTLAGMEFSGASQRAKMRQKKKAEREEKELRYQEELEKESHVLKLTEYVTTSDIANLMGISANEIILKCMSLGLMVTINQRLDKDTIILIADDYGFEVEFIDEQKSQVIEDEDDPDDTLESRPPIVTIMGHVDHGKTSLLDYIRNSNVVSGEAGGITQHIGAYRVEMPDGRSITFLDTPGHEAFTAMRARGAQITDIVVLVVAADDSVMPQTIEAISHAKAANVPIVVAINKIDKPDANPDRIKQQLTDYGILVEEWGGKNQSVEISAKKGLNIELLLEKILLEADLLDLKANPDRKARGAVIESNMSKGLGPVATIIVQKGTLTIGDPFVAGIHSGKVRNMFDERGNRVDEAGPSFPVRVIGFDGLPSAGDTFFVTHNDVEARSISNERKQLRREQDLRQVRHVTLDEISAQIQIGGVQDLYLVIKGDVNGSVEAISDSLLKLSRDEVRVNILHKGVGAISESDVMLAAASSAVVIGFNVSPTNSARKIAETEHVDIRQYDIIYDCINEIQLALEGLLKPELKEEVVGEIEVRKVFKISRLGSIAGCYVLNGKVNRNDKIRVLRNGLPVFSGSIHSLKRSKDDVKEIDQGYECGIQLEGFNDFEENDIIQAYKVVEIKRTFK